MKKGFAYLLFFLFTLIADAHPWDPAVHVIVTTDGGLDDMRAITFLLADPTVQVTAIIAADGVLTAPDTWEKVRQLLERYHHEGIPVGLYRRGGMAAKGCPAARAFRWGPDPGDTLPPPPADSVAARIFRFLPAKITWISLGSLAPAAHLLGSSSSFLQKTEKILWSADGDDLQHCFNYALDPSAYQRVGASGLPLHIICGPDAGNLYDPATVDLIAQSHTPEAEAVYANLRTTLPGRGELCDDGVFLFLTAPRSFTSTKKGTVYHHRLRDTALARAREKLIETLDHISGHELLILDHLPADPSAYRNDVRNIVTATIDRYGSEEWAAAVITGELHRHLGVFAIIGVKMGIRAREYFNVGPDAMKVISCAGSRPPLSCLNDGLQAATGATLGHGLITVADTGTAPCARFFWLGNTITLSLKKNIADTLSARLQEMKGKYGLESDTYWDLLREMTIREWQALDRHNIFEIVGGNR